MGAGVCECCGREIVLPVKLTVLSEGPKESYSACPFCFSRVVETKAEAVVEPVLDKKLEKVHAKGRVKTVEAGVGGCGHHLGYLKERVKNTVIPDECLVCPKILQCMI